MKLNAPKLALTAGLTAVIVRLIQIILIKILHRSPMGPWGRGDFGWGFGRGGMMMPWVHSIAWLVGTFVIAYLAGFIFAWIYNKLLEKK